MKIKNIEKILNKGLNNEDFNRGVKVGFKAGYEQGKALYEENCIYFQMDRVYKEGWESEDVPSVIRYKIVKEKVKDDESRLSKCHLCNCLTLSEARGAQGRNMACECMCHNTWNI